MYVQRRIYDGTFQYETRRGGSISYPGAEGAVKGTQSFPQVRRCDGALHLDIEKFESCFQLLLAH